MHISVLNKSTLLKGKEAELAVITSAVQYQLRRHAAPLFEWSSSDVTFYADELAVPPASNPILIFDDADQAGALGYHWETPDGHPYGRVFVKPVLDAKGTLDVGEMSVSAVLSHEVLELRGDPDCNLWAEAPDGSELAYELCDAVEADSYIIHVKGHPVSVSNFCTPSWFDSVPAPGVRYDWMRRLVAPFSMSPGGYVIRKWKGVVNEVYAAGGGSARAAHATKTSPASRTARRHKGTGLAAPERESTKDELTDRLLDQVEEHAQLSQKDLREK